MLSYRHIYHAGNVADVFKHATLTLVLQALQRKSTPLCYLETHSGAGHYDLTDAPAVRTAEYTQGIMRLWQSPEIPDALAPYMNILHADNPDTDSSGMPALTRYPGSPCIARALLRPQDRMILCELHNTDIQGLRGVFHGDKQVAIHHQDGYQGLEAFLPPRENRGLVLIDPPYELRNEFLRAYEQLQAAHKRWPTGCYMLWYPLISDYPIAALHKNFCTSGIRKILLCELSVSNPPSPRMTGSGLIIINPPWQLDSEMTGLLPWLWQCLAPEKTGAWKVRWLVPE